MTQPGTEQGAEPSRRVRFLEMPEVENLEPHKRSEIEGRESPDVALPPSAFVKPFGTYWGSSYWTKWATIAYALEHLEVEPDARVLDVGCGSGWTSLFLAEAGYRPLGLDISTATIQTAAGRARRWGVKADFAVGDMDQFEIGEKFDAALVFDALHHSTRPAAVVGNVARHLEPGGWVLFGEPSVLHAWSPGARRASREQGWIERGVSVRRLKRDCESAGLANFRRFWEGTGPYGNRWRAFGWQLARLIGGNFAVAPQASVWLAAQRR
jgi:SAM-dependent methyltransferase